MPKVKSEEVKIRVTITVSYNVKLTHECMTPNVYIYIQELYRLT